MQVSPEVQQVMVTDDNTRICLPSGPRGSDNYVLGLAIDRTRNTVSAAAYDVHDVQGDGGALRTAVLCNRVLE